MKVFLADLQNSVQAVQPSAYAPPIDYAKSLEPAKPVGYPNPESGAKKPYSISMPEGMQQCLKMIAKEESMTVAAYVQSLVREAVRKRQSI